MHGGPRWVTGAMVVGRKEINRVRRRGEEGFGGQSEGWTRIEAILELAVYG